MEGDLRTSDVARRVAAIEAAKTDTEAAHSMEDKLHQDVLMAIAEERCADPVECARLALTSLEIDFFRYCA